MALRAIVFDVDGVLVDSQNAIARSLAHTMIKFGFTPVPHRDEILAHQGSELSAWIRNLLPKEAACDEKIVSEMRAHSLKQYCNVYLPILVQAKPDARQVLDELHKGYALGVATNNDAKIAQKILEITEFSRFFRAVASTGQEGCKPKPAPDLLLSVLSQLNCLPQDALFVGDSACDLQAGKSAGVRTVLVKNGFNKKLKARHKIGALSELGAIVEKIQKDEPAIG